MSTHSTVLCCTRHAVGTVHNREESPCPCISRRKRQMSPRRTKREIIADAGPGDRRDLRRSASCVSKACHYSPVSNPSDSRAWGSSAFVSGFCLLVRTGYEATWCIIASVGQLQRATLEPAGSIQYMPNGAECTVCTVCTVCTYIHTVHYIQYLVFPSRITLPAPPESCRVVNALSTGDD